MRKRQSKKAKILSFILIYKKRTGRHSDAFNPLSDGKCHTFQTAPYHIPLSRGCRDSQKASLYQGIHHREPFAVEIGEEYHASASRTALPQPFLHICVINGFPGVPGRKKAADPFMHIPSIKEGNHVDIGALLHCCQIEYALRSPGNFSGYGGDPA